MKQRFIRIAKGAGFLLPFFIGTAGFFLAMQDGLINAMYRAMRLYIMELDCEYAEITPLIQIARWTAPMMSAAAILTFLSRFWTALRQRFLIWKNDAVAIHGDGEAAAHLREQLGSRAVEGGSAAAMGATRHVLSFKNDREALAYLSGCREKLFQNGHKVYLCADEIGRGNYDDQNLVLCNLSEICARTYWRENPLRFFSGERRIVIIGFGSCGRNILTHGLLINVYGKDSRIRYDVFGDSKAYRDLHRELGQMVAVNREDGDMDQVWFHETPWYGSPEILEQADRIILCEEEDARNLEILSQLDRLIVTKQVHVHTRDASLLEDLWKNAVPFGTAERIYTEGAIIDEDTMLDAKRIHANYFGNFQCEKRERCGRAKPGDCPFCPEMLSDWSRQNNHIIYSNVAQADHIPVKIQLMLEDDDFRQNPKAAEEARGRYDRMQEDQKEALAEIEHLRWNRYHYMYNWQYAAKRDNAHRRHPDLVPFDELGPEKQKDVSAWENAFVLYHSPAEGAQSA